MTNPVYPGYIIDKNTPVFLTEVKRRVTRKQVFSRRLVYTLSNNTLFNIGVNPDVKIDVKFEPNVKECVVSKGALESARMAAFCRLQQKRSCLTPVQWSVAMVCASDTTEWNGNGMEECNG